SNDTANDSTTINQLADLTIAKSHTGNFTQGQSAAYTITAANSGTASTSGTVTVTATVPAGLTPTAATGTGWGPGTNACSISGQTVTCTRNDVLAAGNSYPAITLTANINVPNAGGRLFGAAYPGDSSTPATLHSISPATA